MAEITGGCLCGHIRYRTKTAPLWAALWAVLCHCVERLRWLNIDDDHTKCPNSA